MSPCPEHNEFRRVLRFGMFQLDLKTGELLKGGVRLKLQGKPFQLLQALLESPGEVVTREELKRRLWPEDTFVDFDSGLNTAANRLRATLGDSAERPRFVETMARTGYRFVGAVEDADAPPVRERKPALWLIGIPFEPSRVSARRKSRLGYRRSYRLQM